MIVDKEVMVKIVPINFKWFVSKGYAPFKVKDEICVKIEDIMPSSKVLINVKCSVCSEIKQIRNQNYIEQLKKGGYYVCKKCNNYKVKETNLKKYGYECSLQNEEVRNKSLETIFNLYGVDNVSKSKEIKDKKIETCQKNYGVDYPQLNFEVREKSKFTLIDKYGVDNASKSDIIKKQKSVTTRKNYGVDNPTQNSEVFEKSQKSGKKIKLHEKLNIYYRGTYEKDFLDFCCECNIKIEKGPRILFEMNGKKKYYHSDFYIKDINLIVEIKSWFTLERFLEKNKLKEKYSKSSGYNFLFIVDKNYEEFLKIIKENYEN